MADKIVMEVFRYSPEEGGEPEFKRYEVPRNEDWRILDALNYIKDNLDGSVTYRWSCRMAICGSCGMMVNGVPKLVCETALSEVGPGPVRIEPLAHFPVLKDLVVELDDFMDKLQKVKPWIVRKDDKKPEREFLQTPAELEKFHQFSLCINCTLCYAACPVYGLDSSFTGPAVIALAHRYNLDSRDQGATERTDILSQHDGLWSCTVVGECSVVCPKHVDPSLAIQQYKMTAATEWWKSVLMPGGGK